MLKDLKKYNVGKKCKEKALLGMWEVIYTCMENQDIHNENEKKMESEATENEDINPVEVKSKEKLNPENIEIEEKEKFDLQEIKSEKKLDSIENKDEEELDPPKDKNEEKIDPVKVNNNVELDPKEIKHKENLHSIKDEHEKKIDPIIVENYEKLYQLGVKNKRLIPIEVENKKKLTTKELESEDKLDLVGIKNKDIKESLEISSNQQVDQKEIKSNYKVEPLNFSIKNKLDQKDVKSVDNQESESKMDFKKIELDQENISFEDTPEFEKSGTQMKWKSVKNGLTDVLEPKESEAEDNIESEKVEKEHELNPILVENKDKLDQNKHNSFPVVPKHVVEFKQHLNPVIPTIETVFVVIDAFIITSRVSAFVGTVASLIDVGPNLSFISVDKTVSIVGITGFKCCLNSTTCFGTTGNELCLF
jgi:hypothetical protein